MTLARARWLMIRAHLAFATWLVLAALLAGVAVGIGLQVLEGAPQTPPATLLVVPPVLWIATWIVLVFGTVWWYRKGILAAVTADDLETRERVGRLVRVRPAFAIRELVGVDVAGLTRTRIARWLDGWHPLVLHLSAAAMLVLAAALVR